LQVTGSVELKTSTRGRKSKLSEKDLNQISALIIEKPDITLQEIKDELKLDCDISVLCRAIRHKLGFTRKKKVYTPLKEISPKYKPSEKNG